MSAPDPYEPSELDPAGETPPAEAEGKPMGFLEHLEELRWTLIKCAVVFLVFVTAIAYNLNEASHLLSAPLDQVKAEYPQYKAELITTSPMGVFSVIINICLIGGLLAALPFWLFFIGQFVAPALTRRERGVLVPTAIAGFGLFLLGAAFGYFFLTPSTIRVSYELNELFRFDPMWTADNYYSLLMWLVLGMGAAFEFPLVVVLAVYMGLIEVATLRLYRRHAIVLMFVIAAFVTPTPDPINMTMVAVPLVVLYELAILVSSRIGRRRHAET